MTQPSLSSFLRTSAVFFCLGVLLSAPYTSAQDYEPSQSNRFMTETENRITEIESRLMDLTGRFEEVNHQNKVLKSELERLSKDIDFRFNELSSSAHLKSAASDSSKSSHKLEEPKDHEDRKDETQKEFDAALLELNNEEYSTAILNFKKFIKKHPKHSNIGNAKYWLGEAYYAKGEFEEASIHFADVYQNHKKSSRAPDSLVKLALALKSMKKKTEACTVIKQFKTDFPKAREAVQKLSEKVTKELKCDSSAPSKKSAKKPKEDTEE